MYVLVRDVFRESNDVRILVLSTSWTEPVGIVGVLRSSKLTVAGARTAAINSSPLRVEGIASQPSW